MQRIFRTSSLAGLVVAFCLLAVMGPEPAKAAPMTIVVDTAADNGFPCSPGDCSIRGAIAAANSNPGLDTITFDPGVFPPGGGAPAIVLAGTLPGLPLIDASGGITIDGSGADVRISGEFLLSPYTGFSFYSAPGTPAIDITVHNIGLYSFDKGVKVCAGGGACTESVVNVDLDGVTIGTEEVSIKGSTIAGVSVQDLVITSGGSSRGLDVFGTHLSDVQIEDSSVPWIHVQGSGSVSGLVIANNVLTLPNGTNDVSILGGLLAADVSVINNASNAAASTATSVGVAFYLQADQLERVDVSRNLATSPKATGIAILGTSASDLTVSNNEISAPGSGISVAIRGTVENVELAENTITGAVAEGIYIAFYPGTNNVIHDNTVFDNGGDGIQIRAFITEPQTHVQISHNVTFDNGELGIDLYKLGETIIPGVTLNDAGDTDAGPNDLLNFPVITGDTSQAVNGSACAGCTVELFRSDSDPSGYGEGELWLRDATADGTGQFSADTCGKGLAPGDQVTATATDGDGNTSEFSLNYTINVASGSCLTPTPTPAQTATPTASPGGQAVEWGDNDCSRSIGPLDGLIALQFGAGLSPDTTDCPDVGEQVDVSGASIHPWGDIDCDGAADVDDAMDVLRFYAGLPVEPGDDCPAAGDTVVID